jgi:hypothetical protein
LPDKYLVPPCRTKGLHGGGYGQHLRREVKGLSDAVSSLLRSKTVAPRCAEVQRRVREKQQAFEASHQSASTARRPSLSSKPWSRIEQALRTTDLLLQVSWSIHYCVALDIPEDAHLASVLQVADT